MTRDSKSNEPISSLPNARSPKALDDRILDYAKTQAPEKARFSKPAWMSGLAAASIVGIAIMIALPEQYRTQYLSARDTMPQHRATKSDSATSTDTYLEYSSTLPKAGITESAELLPSPADIHSAGEVAVEEKPSAYQAVTERHKEPNRKTLADLSNLPGEGSSLPPPSHAPSLETNSRVAVRASTTIEAEANLETAAATASRAASTMEDKMISPRKREHLSALDSELGMGEAALEYSREKLMDANQPLETLPEKARLKLDECILKLNGDSLGEARKCYSELMEQCLEAGMIHEPNEHPGPNAPANCSLPQTIEEAALAFPIAADPNAPRIRR
jgi:hypothetical protein